MMECSEESANLYCCHALARILQGIIMDRYCGDEMVDNGPK